MRVRIVSYNIKIGAETSLDEVGRGLASLSPDIVALQEVGLRWLWGEKADSVSKLSAATKLPHTLYAPALASFDGGSFGVALLSRYPLQRARVLRLSRVVDEPRVLACARVDVASHSLWVATTHLSYKEDRISQARQIAEHFATLEGHKILLGDLNAEPEEGLHKVAAPGMVDAFAAKGRGKGLTFSVAEPKWRLDYAMIDPRLVIERCEVPAVRASDHFPLLVDLAL
jgi:endonuclease/exonuclease/phosphatase family metal-dependent hydrolase